jgi:hypothetical protein
MGSAAIGLIRSDGSDAEGGMNPDVASLRLLRLLRTESTYFTLLAIALFQPVRISYVPERWRR